MPVRPTPVEFPFAGGLDTKTDEKLVQMPSVVDLKNAVFSKHGSLKKRTGYTALSDTDITDTALSSLTRLDALDSQLVAAGGGSLYGYSANLDTWVDYGSLPEMEPVVEILSDRSATQVNPVSAIGGGIRVTAWTEDAALHYQITDLADTVLKPVTSLGTGFGELKAVGTPSGVLLICRNTATVDINSFFFSTDNLGGTQREYLLANLHGDYLWDAAPLWVTPSSDTKKIVAIAYKNTSSDITTFFVNDSGSTDDILFGPYTTSATTSVTTSLTLGSGSHGQDPQTGTHFIYVLYGEADGSTYADYLDYSNGFNNVPASVISELPTYTTIVPKERTGGHVDVIYESSSDGKLYHAGGDYSSLSGTFTEIFSADFDLASKAIRYEQYTNSAANSRWYCLVHYNSTLQDSLLLVDGTTRLPVAVVKSGLCKERGSPHQLPTPTRVGSNWEFVFPLRQRVEVGPSQADAYTQDNAAKLTVYPTRQNKMVSAVNQESLYLTGSSLWQFDGANVVEAGFWFYPELTIGSAGLTVSGGTLNYSVANEPYTITRTDGSAGKTILYYIVYEWTDNQGKRLQSASVPVTCTNFADPSVDNVTLTIPRIPYSYKNSVRAAVYRTHSESTAIAYRIGDAGGAAYPGVDVSSADYSFTDSTAENDLKSGEILYLSSGELDNVFPAPPRTLLSHDDRLFYVTNDDPLRVYFTKRPSDFDQPGFNEGLYIQVPPDGGDVTALGTLDNKLVIFKRDRVYMVSGDGPNNLGVGSYSLPRLVSTDTGCKDANTIVRVPQGLMFQSDKGIYWLNRGEAVNYIGAPVELYNDYTIQSASILPDENLVIFLTNEERTIAFDYERGLWTTFTNHAGLGATVIDDSYYYLRNDGATVYKSADTYTDNGLEYTLEIKTPWIRPGGVQQRWHIRRAMVLGNYSSAHDIDVAVAYNFRSFDAYTQTWDPESALNQDTLGGEATLGGGTLLGGGDGTTPDRVYQFSHLLRDQRIESVQFTFTEVPPASDPGASFELTSLAIEAAGYNDLFKLPGSKVI